MRITKKEISIKMGEQMADLFWRNIGDAQRLSKGVNCRTPNVNGKKSSSPCAASVFKIVPHDS
jgi:hypothetical protein